MHSPDAGHYVGSSRDMAPPPSFQSDFPAPRSTEIEVISSRTLPSPSGSSSATWENFPAPGYGGLSEYGSGRPQPFDTQIHCSNGTLVMMGRGSRKGYPLCQGKGPIQEQEQPNPSDAGSLHCGVPPSDSGYGTRHSDGNASVFSADINDRDQDCQSLGGQAADYQPFQGFNDVVIQQRDARSSEHWPPVPSSSPSNAPGLLCPNCQKPVKTRSELKKHDLRHRKPFVCSHPGCSRTDGFSTTNDLDRHTKSKHASASAQLAPTKRYRCHVPGCKSKEKSWPRLDNFRSHLKRVHIDSLRAGDDLDDMIRRTVNGADGDRAEFWERADSAIGQEAPLLRVSSLSDASRTHGPVTQITLTNNKDMEPNWKPIPVYPEVFEPMHEMPAPKDSILEGHSNAPTLDSNASASKMQLQETVQPKDVFRTMAHPISDTRNKPSSLEIVHLAPVGYTGSASKKTDLATPQPAVTPSQVNVQSKAAKLKDESASNATITEAIMTALAGAGVQENVKDCTPHHDLEQRSLPHGRTSSGGPWTIGSPPSEPSIGRPNGRTNETSGSAVQEDAKSLQQNKVREVLKTLHDLGYIVQKDPSLQAKHPNPGSAASNKSDNTVTCKICKLFIGRPCEVTYVFSCLLHSLLIISRKHMKRHSRPYGCTFVTTCNKTFGSKNDWKRHENSQHFHLETWRCDAKKVDGIACAKVCYRKQSFQDHLKKDHEISSPEILKSKVDSCRIGRNCQARFWCGFCSKLIDLTRKGIEAWTERFDHVDDHFMGRHGLTKQTIQDWVSVDGDKPKGGSPLDLSPEQDSSHDSVSPSSGSSPEASGAAGESPARATNVEETRKRDRSSSDDDGRPAKHAKITQRTDTTVYCV
ncbi:Transcriptional activator GLI3 [Hyphodiscus hymeniophilus]|uniref:Transcriptional activator GLI3 n=1 Tax=Hyphodiscus hymeniophilus TaxID=353542 RepID=A0A9P6VD40_9HELO|nr:Transcriptional activator GLI3 [Hyphodiscus hymeniophilus]